MRKRRHRFQFSVFSFQFENGKILGMCAVLFLALALVLDGHAQPVPSGHATDFKSDTYFEPPNGQKVKMTLSGAEASPLPGGLLDVKQLEIQTFNLDGKTEMVLRAPQCTYALDGVAHSAGHLELQSGDGKIRIEGDGFLWRQADNSLTISNNVHTVIKARTWRMSVP
jgi:hypothetical protein